MIPKKEKVLERARQLFIEQGYRSGMQNVNSPEDSELVEGGFYSNAMSELMHSQGFEYRNYVEQEREACKTYLNHNISKGKIPIDLEECKRSNILISGANQQGKTLCAMSISDLLMRKNWKIVCFDNVGKWKEKSSIENYVVVKDNMRVDFTTSIICDLSLLRLSKQKSFIENTLEELWFLKVLSLEDNWILCVFEEFQLLAKNLRGSLSQNALRIMSVGANWKIRCLGITPDLALIDPAFIRLCQQRYHFKLGNEPNAKRRFRAYYGFDWCQVTQNLDVGFCVYINNDKLEVWKIPMFKNKLKSRREQCSLNRNA